MASGKQTQRVFGAGQQRHHNVFSMDTDDDDTSGKTPSLAPTNAEKNGWKSSDESADEDEAILNSNCTPENGEDSDLEEDAGWDTEDTCDDAVENPASKKKQPEPKPRMSRVRNAGDWEDDVGWGTTEKICEAAENPTNKEKQPEPKPRKSRAGNADDWEDDGGWNAENECEVRENPTGARFSQREKQQPEPVQRMSRARTARNPLDNDSVLGSTTSGRSFLADIERTRSRSKHRSRSQKSRSCSKGRSLSKGRRRENFMPRKRGELELFDESRLVNQGKMFDDINALQEHDITVQSSDGKPMKIKRIEGFEQCGFSSEIAKNLELAKFQKPTSIQKVVIPIMQKRRCDVMAHAQTGSGKTGAFLLPIISELQHVVANRVGPPDRERPYVLVVAPTKELVRQLYDDARAFALHTRVTVAYTHGETPMATSLFELKAGCDIFIATCGRLHMFIEKNIIELSELRYLVLDEADKLLKIQPFYACLKLIKKHKEINPAHRTLMFSATFGPEINDLVTHFLRENFVRVQCGENMDSVVETVTQTFLKVKLFASEGEKDKQTTLVDFLLNHKKTKLVPDVFNGEDYWKVPKTIVFIEMKRHSYRLALHLNQRKIRALSLNADLTTRQRDATVSKFAANMIDVLVATNLIGRGMNFPKVEYVINYDLPKYPGSQDEYVHQIGRTGRIGNSGASFSYFDPNNEADRSNAGFYVKVLKKAKVRVPTWLNEIAQEYALKHEEPLLLDNPVANSTAKNSRANSPAARSQASTEDSWKTEDTEP